MRNFDGYPFRIEVTSFLLTISFKNFNTVFLVLILDSFTLLYVRLYTTHTRYNSPPIVPLLSTLGS
nr:MAG TPA: hypothetical protein [Caudoviricetes sp.]